MQHTKAMENPTLDQLNQDLNDWRLQLKQAARQYDAPGKNFRLSLHPLPGAPPPFDRPAPDPVKDEHWSFPNFLNVTQGTFLLCWGESVEALLPRALHRLCLYGLVFSISPGWDNIFHLLPPPSSTDYRFVIDKPEHALHIYACFDKALSFTDPLPSDEDAAQRYTTSMNNLFVQHAPVAGLQAYVDKLAARTDGPFELQSLDVEVGYRSQHRLYKLALSFLPSFLQEENYGLSDLTGLSRRSGENLAKKFMLFIIGHIPHLDCCAMILDVDFFSNIIREAGENA